MKALVNLTQFFKNPPIIIHISLSLRISLHSHIQKRTPQSFALTVIHRQLMEATRQPPKRQPPFNTSKTFHPSCKRLKLLKTPSPALPLQTLRSPTQPPVQLPPFPYPCPYPAAETLPTALHRPAGARPHLRFHS